jgi:hypothetical protein
MAAVIGILFTCIVDLIAYFLILLSDLTNPQVLLVLMSGDDRLMRDISTCIACICLVECV